MGARKIANWHEAGLIDSATRDRLIAYEAAHTRPIALWAVFGIGALAIGLGLVSVVAANWEVIPGFVRLSVHLALIAGALVTLGLREPRLADASPWAAETLLFVAAALGLTFFGHLGQVYQTSSPLWQPLGLWLVLFAPLLLLMGRSWLAAASLMGAIIWCVWDYADSGLIQRAVREVPTTQALWLGLVTAVPVMIAPLAAWWRSRSARSDFWRRLEQAALSYGVAGASFACVLASTASYGSEALAGSASMVMRGVIGVVAGAVLVWARPGASGRMAGLIIAGAGVMMPLALLVSGLLLPAALLFMALWTGIAGGALRAQWRGVFQLAVAIIALRLIILSFELASDLLLSGFGLILAGFLVLGVGWGALKVSRAFAPASDISA
jgi:uncharacterized membrane protein